MNPWLSFSTNNIQARLSTRIKNPLRWAARCRCFLAGRPLPYDRCLVQHSPCIQSLQKNIAIANQMLPFVKRKILYVILFKSANQKCSGYRTDLLWQCRAITNTHHWLKAEICKNCLSHLLLKQLL